MAPIPFSLDASSGLAPWAAVAVGVAGVPIAMLLLFTLVVVGWKLLRRHRRRTRPTPTGRIAGAWAEAIDRCNEAGAPRLTDVTPSERVQVYVADQSLDNVESDLRTLAGQVDRAAFAAVPPADEHADAAWRASDEVSAELRRERSLTQRVRMHLDPRPLRRDLARSGARPPEADR